MPRNVLRRSVQPPKQQHGIVLFTSLIFLLILTVIGLAALNNNGLQTRMAIGHAETNASFQSAESALVAGEAWLTLQTAQPSASCANPCSDTSLIWPRVGLPTPILDPATLDSETWWTANGRVLGQSIDNVSAQPRYAIEELGPDNTGSLTTGLGTTYKIYYFQVTSRGYGAQSTSRTVVQSVFARGY
jgi:type IV pilus assembly protein PilX